MSHCAYVYLLFPVLRCKLTSCVPWCWMVPWYSLSVLKKLHGIFIKVVVSRASSRYLPLARLTFFYLSDVTYDTTLHFIDQQVDGSRNTCMTEFRLSFMVWDLTKCHEHWLIWKILNLNTRQQIYALYSIQTIGTWIFEHCELQIATLVYTLWLFIRTCGHLLIMYYTK